MKAVWLLIEDHGCYDGFTIRGAFSSEEKAQAAMDAWKEKNQSDDMYIQDWNLDETCGEK
jgi:hypothetical protein